MANVFDDMNAEQRFAVLSKLWSRVDKGGGEGCWRWQWGVTKAGYATMTIRGKQLYAHRIVYELCIGPIPDGLFVCHHCDNRRCVRPDHLFVGTAKDNTQDMVRKGRSVRGRKTTLTGHRGESNHRAKLTASQVRTIRVRYAAGGVSQENLATEYGVSQWHICGIVKGKFWRHLNDAVMQ